MYYKTTLKVFLDKKLKDAYNYTRNYLYTSKKYYIIFKFSAGNCFTFGNHHKNLLCKSLADLKKCKLRQKIFLSKQPQFKLYGILKNRQLSNLQDLFYM